MTRKWTLEGLARDLRDGKVTSRELVEQGLAKISDPAGEGARAFIKVDAEGARAAADHQDQLRRQQSPAIAIRRHSHFGERPF